MYGFGVLLVTSGALVALNRALFAARNAMPEAYTNGLCVCVVLGGVGPVLESRLAHLTLKAQNCRYAACNTTNTVSEAQMKHGTA